MREVETPLFTFLAVTQIFVRAGAVKDPLPIRLRSSPSIIATFLSIFAAALQSALIYQFRNPVRYKPRLTRLPVSLHPSGFSPIVGRKSLSTNEAFEV